MKSEAAKAKRKTSKSGWFVVQQDGGDSADLHVLYRGPDRVKARDAVESALAEIGKSGNSLGPVQVLRFTRSVTLTTDSLVQSLPHKAF